MAVSFATLKSALCSLETLFTSRFNTNPEGFVEESKTVINDILTNNSTQCWSVQSFAWDLQNAYAWRTFATSFPSDDALAPRPGDALKPRVPRLAIETWIHVDLRSVPGDPEWAPAVRFVDQFYSMFSSMASMPLKSFYYVPSDNGIDAGFTSSFSGKNRIAGLADTNELVIKELQAKLTFVQDRVDVLQAREKLLLSNLDTATRRILSLRHLNGQLTNKVAQQQSVSQRRKSMW